jgi:hypothetical protein
MYDTCHCTCAAFSLTCVFACLLVCALALTDNYLDLPFEKFVEKLKTVPSEVSTDDIIAKALQIKLTSAQLNVIDDQYDRAQKQLRSQESNASNSSDASTTGATTVSGTSINSANTTSASSPKTSGSLLDRTTQSYRSPMK